MEVNLINRKLEFIINHLEQLNVYRDKTIDDLKIDNKLLKYVEKTIQEIIDASIDINQYILEYKFQEKAWSAKQSFFELQNKVLLKENIAFTEEELKLFIDSISFRNEIIHSYDINVYIIWAKRNLAILIDIFQKYAEKIQKIKIKNII